MNLGYEVYCALRRLNFNEVTKKVKYGIAAAHRKRRAEDENRQLSSGLGCKLLYYIFCNTHCCSIMILVKGYLKLILCKLVT